jgi:tetratricopeptide (TPR) repeat protein
MPNRLSRLAEGVMEAAWLIALVVTPLFFDIFSARVFEPDKITLLRSLALVALAAWLVKLISEGGPRFDAVRSQYASLRGFLRVPLVVPVATLVFVYIVATIFSVSPYASLYGSYQRLQGTFSTFSYLMLFVVLVANLRRRAQVDRAITLAIVCSLPGSLYGILQHFRLDPLPWGGDTTARVTGSMGNAIFLAAYLIMTSPLALARVVTSFHGILTDEEPSRLPFNVIRAAIYIFIFAVNLVAIWYTSSRGPWLGLLAGFFMFFVLLSLHWRARRLTLVTIGLAGIMAVFLVLLNIPNGPLESVRQLPGVGRLGNVFETEGGTGKVRVLIWNGIVRLMLPHPPIAQPDGTADRWNAIRPLIGYGPEALYVAYNRFYPPDLAHLEARNASPDRSHNETFDALAFTGILGLVAYLMLFVAVFYYALKWLGLITTPARRNAFLGLVVGGGALSAAGFILWQGPEFFGVGLPFGMLIGLIIFLTLYALVALPRLKEADSTEAPLAAPDRWRAIALIGLFSAIVAHFAEIHFGIAIVSTRTHFWLFTGLMMVLGFIAPAAAPAVEMSAAAKARRVRARPGASTPEAKPWQEQWGPVLVGGMVIAAVLVTLGFDFITNNGKSTQAGKILVDSFTMGPAATGSTRSFAILGLLLITWLGGGALVLLEEPQTARGRGLWATVGAGLGVAAGVTLIAYIAMSSQLAAISSIQPTNIPQLLQSAGAVAFTLTVFYILLGLVLVGLAAALIIEPPAATGRSVGRNRGLANASPVALLAYVSLPILAVAATVFLNLQVIQADIVYKTGLQFDDAGSPLAAIPLFERALDLAPGEDYYYLFLGRSYLNATNAQTDPAQREALLARAEEQLKVARGLNPLNTDHTANLARLNRRWAELSADAAVRATHAEASRVYYSQAVQLSPNNAGLWNEWAALEFQVLNDLASAQTHLDQSMSIDQEFEQTYLLQGDLYSTQARAITDTVAQKPLFEQAIAAYEKGITVAEARGTPAGNLRVNLASAHVGLGQPEKAIAIYQEILSKADGGVNSWEVYLAISQLYAQMGNMDQARANAQLALQAAPDTDKANVQSWIDRLP